MSKTITNREALIHLGACAAGLARAAESHTLREWWETSTTRSDMMWLIGRANVVGTLTRRRLVHVAVRCSETVAHLLPLAALPLLADLSAWTHGVDDVDLSAWTHGDDAHVAADADAAHVLVADDGAYAADAATAVAYAAYAADAATAVAYAADAATAYAAYAAYAATALAAHAADAHAAMCDVIRDAITLDEVCAALGLDPDQGVL